MAIEVLFQDVDSFDIDETSLTSSIVSLAFDFGKTVGDITVVFCSDDFILQTNNQYLQHDYYTDVITFDYCEGDVLSGDLLISIDTVLSNSVLFDVDYRLELFRVVLHGVLHLCGLDDKSESETVVMRSAEEQYLAVYVNPF